MQQGTAVGLLRDPGPVRFGTNRLLSTLSVIPTMATGFHVNS